ncbi:MAG: GDSL-type esterase/lipase family protein [Bacteroidales bacterium]|jgi:lysophospholipase L1-like esterase|nr:GDSL-type esterase/lipase family protein [Bacteroidales bacterium]
MRILKISIYVILFTAFTFAVKSQGLYDSLPFINYNENSISVRNYESIKQLIHKFKDLKTENFETIKIVHIGDSHLQAGFLTEKIKQSLFQYYSDKNGFAAPGFIFPYTIAQTNNPFFYKVKYTGNWDSCRNVDSEKTCKLGLSGITVRTNDSIASFSIKMQNEKYDYPQKYFFNTIKIFHNTDSSLQLIVNNKIPETKKGFSQIHLDNLTDSLSINISINDTNKFFELYGLILENEESKINYHTIGINGATAQSYLKCDYFSGQLGIINPDLIIISLGTNEAYETEFSSVEHLYILRDLILQIKNSVPNASILLITPNDHLKDKKINNPNILSFRYNIFKICDELQISSWDFHSIMGGEHSIIQWYNKGLVCEDRLHFKKIGYEIQGKLFTEALLDLIEKNDLK